MSKRLHASSFEFIAEYRNQRHGHNNYKQGDGCDANGKAHGSG